jgi:hypothetical protein
VISDQWSVIRGEAGSRKRKRDHGLREHEDRGRRVVTGNRMTWRMELRRDDKSDGLADKRCWVKMLSLDGGNRNCMTWPAKLASNDT